MSGREWIITIDGKRELREVQALVPSLNLCWFTDYDGERVLLQEFRTVGGERLWKGVPDFAPAGHRAALKMEGNSNG